MAAIIQLRRGSSPSSLSYGEIYVNDDSASLVLRLSGSGDIVTLTKLEQKNHGNLWIDGDITASSISASGDIRIGGELYLGDEVTDNIVIQGSLSSSLIPQSDNQFDLGSTTKKYKDLYVGTIHASNTVISGQANISGSEQITAFGFISGSDLNSLNAYTSSNNIRIDGIDAVTSSFDTRITQLETDTGSQDQRLDRLELETGSINTTNTAQNTRLTTLETKTGSLDTNITTINGRLGNVETTTASFDSRLDNLESNSGSSNTFQADATIQLNNIESTTSSFDGRLNNIESTTSSFDGRLDNLESTTASIDVRIGGIDTTTASLDGRLNVEEAKSTTLATVTSSLDGRLDVEEAKSTTLATVTSSFDQRLDRLQLETSSLDGRLDVEEGKSTTLQTVTASLEGRLNNVETTTSSHDDRLSNLETSTGSSDVSLTNVHSFTSSFNTAITLDSTNVTVLGNLTVQGSQTQLNTQTLNIEDKNLLIASGAADSAAANGAGITIDGANKSLIWDHDDSNFLFDARVSSSVGFVGDGSGLTGVTANSVAFNNITSKPTLLSGSKQITDFGFISGSDLDRLHLYTASADIRLSNLETTTASLDSRLDVEEGKSTTIETVTSSFDGRLTNIESTTSSLDGRLDNVESTTSSLDTRLTREESKSTTLEGVTSSLDSRLDIEEAKSTTLEGVTSSLDSRLDNVESTTSSFSGRLTNLESTTSSLDSRLDNVETITSSFDQRLGRLQLETASIDTRIDGIDTITASFDSRLDQVETFTGSQDNKFTNIHLTTQSLDSRLDNVETTTSSLVSRVDQLTTFTGSVGTAAFFNVTSSIFNDTTVVPTAAAVNDAIVSSGGGDVTSVGAGLGLSGGGVSGDLTLALNTGSSHFINAVTANAGATDISSLNSYTASNDTTNSGQDTRLNQLAAATGSYLTSHPSISAGSNISQDNSNGTVIQDLTITLDSNGHVTSSTATTVDLDGRYYTETESDTLFTKKLGQGIISGSQQVIDFVVASDLDMGGNKVLFGNVYSTEGDLPNASTYHGMFAHVHGTGKGYFAHGGNWIKLIDESSSSTSNLSEGSNLYYTDARVKTKLTAETVISGSGQVVLQSADKTGFTGASSITTVGTIGTGTWQGTVIDKTYLDDEVYNTSLNSYTASNNVDIANLESFTSSVETAIALDSSNVTILGNLTVQGSTTELDVTNLNVADKNILIASGAADSAAADGAGITIGGANETLTWVHSDSRFSFSDDLHVVGNITLSGTVDGIDISAIDTDDVSEATNKYYTDARVKTKLDAETVVSGSSQVLGILSSLNTYTSSNDTTNNTQTDRLNQLSTETGSITTEQALQDTRLNQLAAATSSYLTSVDISSDTNLAVSDTNEVNMILTGDTLSAELIGGVVSGSSQITIGGDATGSANDINVIAINGVAISNAEASQLANINSVTISNTQWGYLGSSNQGIATSDNVQFAKVGVGGASDATYELKVTGDVGATGDIVAYISSDKRLKDNIQPIEGALDKVSQISGNTFDWNEEKQNIYKGKDYGVIAQEIQEVMPELVDTRDNGYLAVKYDKIVPLLIESIKELKKEIEELKSK